MQVQDGAVGFAGPFQKRNMTRRWAPHDPYDRRLRNLLSYQ